MLGQVSYTMVRSSVHKPSLKAPWNSEKHLFPSCHSVMLRPCNKLPFPKPFQSPPQASISMEVVSSARFCPCQSLTARNTQHQQFQRCVLNYPKRTDGDCSHGQGEVLAQ